VRSDESRFPRCHPSQFKPLLHLQTSRIRSSPGQQMATIGTAAERNRVIQTAYSCENFAVNALDPRASMRPLARLWDQTACQQAKSALQAALAHAT
jgi:hypothetical protein